MIAALFVEKGGVYYGLDDVDPWDKERDARLYAGPWPVVAHPPCERWGRYWGGGPSASYPRKLGDDGGCFESALSSAAERARGKHSGIIERLSKSERAATPAPFRDVLLDIARTATRRAA